MNQTRPQIGQDYSQFSPSEGVLSFSGSTTVTVIQPFTSNHRPRELWEIPPQRLKWIEVFTRHVQVDTCLSGGGKTSTWALPAPQQSQASLLTHPHCPAAYPNICVQATSNNRPYDQWSYIHFLNDSTSLFLKSKFIQSMRLIPTLHRIHHLLMQPQTMKEGSQMSANVIIFFINLSSIHPEPKNPLRKKKKKAHRGTLCSMEIYWPLAVFVLKFWPHPLQCHHRSGLYTAFNTFSSLIKTILHFQGLQRKLADKQFNGHGWSAPSLKKNKADESQVIIRCSFFLFRFSEEVSTQGKRAVAWLK